MREEGEKRRGRSSTREGRTERELENQKFELRSELIICSLPGNYLLPLDYGVVVKLSVNNCPHCSPEWETVFIDSNKKVTHLTQINRFLPTSLWLLIVLQVFSIYKSVCCSNPQRLNSSAGICTSPILHCIIGSSQSLRTWD